MVGFGLESETRLGGEFDRILALVRVAWKKYCGLEKWPLLSCTECLKFAALLKLQPFGMLMAKQA